MHKALIIFYCLSLGAYALNAQDSVKDGWDARLDMGYEWLQQGCPLEVLDSCDAWLSQKHLPPRRAEKVDVELVR